MPKLARFSPPAGLRDPDPAAWNRRVKGLLAQYVGDFPQFYDPTAKNTPANAAEPMVSWVAFPARVRTQTPGDVDRWKRADGDRNEQDEYCEWTVERKRGKLTRVTFTTEVPEYWDHLFEEDPDKVLRLYRDLVSPDVKPADLRDPGGGYKRENKWNTSGSGRLVHLIQGSNNLGAAVDLVARATELREKNGQPVTNQQELVACAQLGDPRRNSDPQIASAVNVQAGLGNEITFTDPPGLHLGRPLTAGMLTPDGADAADFWKIDRGDADHTLRAHFEVPKNKNYVLGDIEVNGRPIKFGAELADRVQVWVSVTVKPGNHQPTPKPCGG